MNDFTMVIPSYWGQNKGAEQPADKAVFDHPTSLGSEGTLGRLLESLEIFDRVPGKIVIIAVANLKELAVEVEQKIDRIIAPFRRYYNITCLGQRKLEKIRNRLTTDKRVSPKAMAMVNLESYAAVRNICSLAGILEGSPYTVYIDDDEVFEDKFFLQKIAGNMGSSLGEDTVSALAGYYLQPDTYLLDESKVPSWREQHWNNAAAMNRAFEQIIGRGERLKPTPFVFGGNMALSLEALQKVPFDPKITRGEDIDFLLNLRINGITFYLDRELSIKHLPPPSDQPSWKKVREDTVRFLYERKKLLDHPELSLDDLKPYPGMFLGDDLEERIIKTCELLIEKYESGQNRQGVVECRKIIEMVREKPFDTIDTRTWLEKVTADWREVTGAATSLGIPE
ncbi:hypothetical protein ACFL4P_02175 [Gemmatimonadota bacterium]